MSAFDYSITTYNAALADLDDENFVIKRHAGVYVLYNGTKMLTDGDIDHIKKRAYVILKERGMNWFLASYR